MTLSSLAGRLAAVAASAVGAAPGVAHAIEQPAYTVVAEYPGWELRSYDPFLEARVTVSGQWDDAVSSGFRVLAGYIFGGNLPQQSIAMTAPVTAQRGAGQSIAMTAPVAAQRTLDDNGMERWTVAFSMPSVWSMQTLPVPDDPRIELVEVPARRVAAVQFGLWATESRVASKTTELLSGLAQAGLQPEGAPLVAQYNPPWTPPPFRNNEILVTVRSAESTLPET